MGKQEQIQLGFTADEKQAAAKNLSEAIKDNPFAIMPKEDAKVEFKKTTMLALDLSTNTGFCCSTASGVWSLAPKKDESKGMRLIRFKAKLKEVCQAEEIKLIVFEQIAVYGKFPNTVGIEMIGVLKLFCEENDIDYKPYPVKSIKKETGNGNASKADMVAFAQRYKPGIKSDDEADAIILYQLAIKDLNL